MRQPRWNEALQCYVNRLEYNFRRRQGWLYIPPGSCCDMSACIALFLAIDSACEEIYTHAGEIPDTAYRKVPAGWLALAWQNDTYEVVECVAD